MSDDCTAPDWADLKTDSERMESLIDGFGICSVRPDATAWLRALLAAREQDAMAVEMLKGEVARLRAELKAARNDAY